MKRPEGQAAIENMDMAVIKKYFILPGLKINIENYLTTVVAWIFATLFLYTALINGFSSKYLFGSNTYFVPNAAQNAFDFAFLATAIGIIVTTLLGEKKSIAFLRVIGKVYVLASLIGFVKIGYYNYSEWTSVINLAFGISMVAAGSILQDYRHDLLVARLIAKQRHHGNCLIIDTIKKNNLRYGMQKRENDTTGEIYCNDDFFETSCIKGEFI
jgi:hypothetical protein